MFHFKIAAGGRGIVQNHQQFRHDIAVAMKHAQIQILKLELARDRIDNLQKLI